MIPEDNPTSAHINTSLVVHIKTQASYGVLNNRVVLMWEIPARSAVGVQWAFSAPTVGHCTCTACSLQGAL